MVQAHKRQMRNYLLDRKYQLRYTLIMVLISSLLTGCLGYFWYHEMRVNSRIGEVERLASMMGSDDIQQIQKDMTRQDRWRLLVLVGFGVLLAFAVAGYSIVLTHKVAGPLFKITRYMHDVSEGNIGPVYDLRKGDQLHEFYEGFKQMHAALRKQVESEIGTLDEVIASSERCLVQAEASRSEGAGELARSLDTLRALRQRKVASLEGRSAPLAAG